MGSMSLIYHSALYYFNTAERGLGSYRYFCAFWAVEDALWCRLAYEEGTVEDCLELRDKILGRLEHIVYDGES